MVSLTAADMMARSESTVSPDTDIYVALRQLLNRKFTGMPVVDGDGVLLGMLTERDCLKVVVGWVMDRLPEGKVRDYMSSPAESIPPTASLYAIVDLFLNRPYRKLPVVDEAGRVIGQVSRRDALVALDSLAKSQNAAQVPDPYLPDLPGVDSAMKIARGQR